MTLLVRRLEAAEWPTFVEIRRLVIPEWPTSLEEIEWNARTYPGGVLLLAELGGRAVGVASGDRFHVHPPDYPVWWAEILVLPEARRRGVGSALLSAIAPFARDAGKSALHVPVSEARPEGVEFLEHRGFQLVERMKAVRLQLDGAALPDIALPEGIRLVSLAERPDLLPGVHRVALATFDDIPTDDEPIAPGDLEEFRGRDVDRPGIRADGFLIALAGEDVVGYASMLVDLGRPTVAYHDMTAVLSEWRGRGVATALKAATIRWAAGAGLAALETGNDESNAAMRAVNARLGYRPLPDLLYYRGSLAD